MRHARTAIALTTLLVAAGCSFSDSVSSPFESSASSSRSSSSSSPARAESYRNEVRDYTAAYVKSSADVAAFRRGMASIASKHGVTDWEADQNSYVGIGLGLKKAKVAPAEFEVWKANLSGGEATSAASMQKGYDSGS
jgi:hypothetical protein